MPGGSISVTSSSTGVAPEVVKLNIPQVCGVNADFLISFEARFEMSGGTFTAVFVDDPNVPTFATRMPITVFQGLQGVVSDYTKSKGSSGIMVRVDGSIINPILISCKPRTYFSGIKWKIPPGGNDELLNNLTKYKNDPTVTIINDMTFSLLVAQIAADHGIQVNYLGTYIDYRIYRFVLEPGSTVYDALQNLAQAAGMNAVAQFNRIDFIPWGTVASGKPLLIPLDDLLGDFSYTTASAEFDSLVITSGTEMTPYNSCYAGLPEKIETLSFESGPVSVIDISFGSGVVQPSKQWRFPEESVTDDPELAKKTNTANSWFRFNLAFHPIYGSASRPLANYISSTKGLGSLTKLWDYTLKEKGNVDYEKYYAEVLKNSRLSTSAKTPLSAYTDPVTVYYGLIRWSRARALIQPQGDIYPFIYVLPSDKAPDKLTIGGFDTEDGQQLNLVGEDGKFAVHVTQGQMDPHITEVYFDIPTELDGITPEGYGFRANLKPDGSFFTDAVFTQTRFNKFLIEEPIQSVKINPEDAFYTDLFGSCTMTKGSNIVIIENPTYVTSSPPFTNLYEHLREVQQRTNSLTFVPKRFPLSVAPNGHLPNTGPSQVSDGAPEEDFTLLNAIDFLDKFQLSAFLIVDITPVTNGSGEVDPTKAKIILGATATFDHTGDYSFCRQRVTNTTLLFNKVTSSGTVVNFKDSGLVDENSETISASWSLYALRRKTFPATYVVSGGSPQAASGSFTHYAGVSEIKDLTFQNTLQQITTRYTKHVSSELISDFIGPNSHLERVAKAIWQYVSVPHHRYSVNVFCREFDLPTIGSEITVDGVSAVLMSYSLNIGQAGAIWGYTAGTMPLL